MCNKCRELIQRKALYKYLLLLTIIYHHIYKSVVVITKACQLYSSEIKIEVLVLDII